MWLETNPSKPRLLRFPLLTWKTKKKKKKRLFHWVNGFFLRHGLGWHTTLSKVYRELRKNFQIGKMVNLNSSCLCLILFTNMTLIVIVRLYASHICIDLMITHRRVSVPNLWRSIWLLAAFVHPYSLEVVKFKLNHAVCRRVKTCRPLC